MRRRVMACRGSGVFSRARWASRRPMAGRCCRGAGVGCLCGSVMSEQLIIRVPRIPLSVRPATMDDLPFIDALQKKHRAQVGWMPTKALVGKIGAGHVLIADLRLPICDLNSIENRKSQIANPVGYVIGQDQYFKRDDVGIIYQMN